MNRPQDAERKRGVLIVDDHPMMRVGIAAVIAAQPDLAVIGEAGNEDEAIALATRVTPDAILLDLSLGESSGLVLLGRLRRLAPAARVLIFSMHDEQVHAGKCIQAGAHGYLMKDQGSVALVSALRTVLEGELYVSKPMRTQLLKGLIQGQGGKAADHQTAPALLTRSEWMILELLGMGYSSRSIADKLKRSIKTVSAHRANIQRKLNLPDQAALMRYAINWTHQGPGPAEHRSAA